MELLIKNARIIDCSQDFTGDLYVKNGKITAIGEDLEFDCETIDAENKVLIPSFIDMHVHFREPGYEYKEDIKSGSEAAVRGGYTAVNLMGNTNPICSSMETVDYVLNRGSEVDLLDIHQSVSITRDFSGSDISHIDSIDTEKVKIITDDGKGILNNKVMLDAMIKSFEKGLVVMAHGEDEEITPFSFRLSENIETIRDIELAKFTGAKLHMAHVSTKESMEYIVEAKQKGYKNITCEVAPHHFYFTTAESDYRVNPPIRESEDVEYIIWAIKNGYVDMIATDHAPHTAEDKKNGAPGMVGLETAFSVSLTALVKRNHISLKELTRLMSKNPAELLGMKKGEIKIGFDADLVLVDLDSSLIIDSSKFKSKGKNTPFDGVNLYGEVLKTVRSGKVVYSKEESQ
jgi:dihydroorotase